MMTRPRRMNVLLCDLGTEGHHLEYAGYICSGLRSRGHTATFVTWAPSASVQAWADRERVPILCIASQQSRHARTRVHRTLETYHAYHWTLKKALENGPSVVHFLHADRNELALRFALGARSPSLRVFATSFWPHFLRTFIPDTSLGRRLYGSVIREALGSLLQNGLLSGLFVHSDAVARELRALPGIRGAPERIITIPDPGRFDSSVSRSDARMRLGLPADVPIALFFGGFRADKGLDVLLRALESTKGELLVVAAGAPYDFPLDTIERARSRLPSNVRLLVRAEHVPDESVELYFAAADFTILPYKRTAIGTSGVLQRSAAAGRPILASDTGLIGGIVRDNSLGLLFHPEDPLSLACCISSALRDPTFFERYRPTLASFAQSCDWRVFAQQVVSQYERVS